MIVVYNKNTGEVAYTIDYQYEFDSELEEPLDYLVTLVEHGNNVLTMRVDLETKSLVSKSAILFSADRLACLAGESVTLTFQHEGEQFGSTFALLVGDLVVQVPYELEHIAINFDLPGEYKIYIPDNRIHGTMLKIHVEDDQV